MTHQLRSSSCDPLRLFNSKRLTRLEKLVGFEQFGVEVFISPRLVKRVPQPEEIKGQAET